MSEEIQVFTSNGWGPCHMVKVYLSQRGVAFTEYNVSNDLEALNRLVDMGYRTTPLTIIGEDRVVGYSTSKLEASLKAAMIIDS